MSRHANDSPDSKTAARSRTQGLRPRRSWRRQRDLSTPPPKSCSLLSPTAQTHHRNETRARGEHAAGGYRTYFKGKWHASHAHLDAENGKGFLLSIDDDGNPQQENIEKYLQADLLDDYGFSEWVGPEPHGLGAHNTGMVKDPFTADETIALLKRFDAEENDTPWLTVCSFLNPHDDSLFGVIALAQGLRYHPSEVPHVEQARRMRRTSRPSLRVSRAIPTRGARSSRRSRGSRRT